MSDGLDLNTWCECFFSVAVGCSSGQSGGSVVAVVEILFFVASRTGVVRERVLVQ